MTRLTMLASADALTGYGQHAIHLIRQFDRHGIFTSLRPLRVNENKLGAELPDDIRARIVRCQQPEPLELLLSPPHHLPTPGKRTVWFTMWESTVLPDKSVEFCNRCVAVVVPSHWCREVFLASGVKVPVHVVPLGVSPEFKPKPWPTHALTTFAAAGRTAHGRSRKGLDSVIRAFLTAFPYDENVRLRIKCHEDCQLAPFIDSRITVARQHLSDAALCMWLADSHCFVSGAKAEGWGLWQHQAMACGRPVIAAPYAGLRDFMSDLNSYPVPYCEVPAEEGWLGSWAQPDEGAIAEAMLSVHSNREEAKLKGERACWEVGPFTWERNALLMINILDQASRAGEGFISSNHDPVPVIETKTLSIVSRPARLPQSGKSFRFFHGLGDCCNAAALFGAVNHHKGPDDQISVQCSPAMEPIFKAAGVPVVDHASEEHLWLHPPYDRHVVDPFWIDNKTAYNSPVPVDMDLWRHIVLDEIRLEQSGCFSNLFSELVRPITLIHTRGVTSRKLKDFSPEMESSFFAQFVAEFPGTLVWIGSGQSFTSGKVVTMKPSSTMMLYEMIQQADLFIGVDSGPLHMARFTDTPVIGCWFAMHPTAFVLPSPRARHLCAAKHPFDNQYGNRERYVQTLESRTKPFNLVPVKEVDATAVIIEALKILC